MHIRTSLLTLSYLLTICLSVSAQVKFSTVVDEREISRNDYLEVQYMVENAQSVEQIIPPAFQGFTVISGPNQQSSMSVVNGAVSKSVGISFVLKPTGTGRFTIAGAKAVADGKQLHSNSVVVRVTNGPSHNQASPLPFSPFGGMNMPDEGPEVTEDYILRAGEKATDKIKGGLLVKLDVNKTSCYIGEPIIATYKLCSRLKSESRVTRRPSLDGFSVYDMVPPEANTQAVEKINGKQFNTHLIRKVQLYPLQDGSFVLDPTEVDNTVHFIRVDNSGSGSRSSMQQLMDEYMNGYSGGKPEDQQVTLATKPVTITVKPLPAADRPLSFDGAVGRFTLHASLDKRSIGANEIAHFKVVLSGEGNIPLINAPQINWPQGIDLYDPSVKEDDDKTVSPIRGTKEFNFSFSVKHPGTVIIPPVELSYFDPKANAYKTLHTDSVVLEVTKGSAVSKPVVTGDTATTRAAAKTPGFDKNRLLLPVALVLLFLGIFIIMLWGRKKDRQKARTPAPAIVAAEPVIPVDPFEPARKALQEGDSLLFYKETGKAVWNALAERLRLGSSQLNKPVVTRLLQEKGVSPAVIAQLHAVLLETEMALYTPVHSERDMKAMLAKAEGFLEELKKA